MTVRRRENAFLVAAACALGWAVVCAMTDPNRSGPLLRWGLAAVVLVVGVAFVAVWYLWRRPSREVDRSRDAGSGLWALLAVGMALFLGMSGLHRDWVLAGLYVIVVGLMLFLAVTAPRRRDRTMEG